MQTQVNHGLSQHEVDAFGAVTAVYLRRCAELRLSIATSYDFVELARLNLDLRDRGCPPLVPWYDPAHEPGVGWPNGFWIGLTEVPDGTEHGAASAGRLVGVIACILRTIRGSLRERLADATFLFPDAAERGASGEATSPDLDLLRGTIMLPGAMWVDPDKRGQRLSKLLFGAAMVEGYRHWKPDHVVGLVEFGKENAIGFDSYRFPRAHKHFVPHVPGIDFTANDEKLAVMSMTQQEMRRRFLFGEAL